MDEGAIEACLTSASFDGVLRGIVSVDQFSTDTAPMDGDSSTGLPYSTLLVYGTYLTVLS